jgi:hypothetical protein
MLPRKVEGLARNSTRALAEFYKPQRKGNEMMRTLKQIIALLWVLGAVNAGLRADLIPPWNKPIRHTVRFANASEVTKFVLYIFPRDLDRKMPGSSSVRVPIDGVVEISALNPLAVSEAKGIYLFAIPKSLHGPIDRPPKVIWFTEETKGVLKCKIPSMQIKSLPKSDSRDKVEEVYEIKLLPERLNVVLIQKEGGAAIDSRRINRGNGAILAGIAALAMVALVVHSRTENRAERRSDE